MKSSPEFRAACNANSEAFERLHRLLQSVLVEHSIDPPVHHRNDDQCEEGREGESVYDGPTHGLPKHVVVTADVYPRVVLGHQRDKINVQSDRQRQQAQNRSYGGQ